ncbi:hypothetical protein MRX96_032831 [Rhipicephalus microplus]
MPQNVSCNPGEEEQWCKMARSSSSSADAELQVLHSLLSGRARVVAGRRALGSSWRRGGGGSILVRDKGDTTSGPPPGRLG